MASAESLALPDRPRAGGLGPFSFRAIPDTLERSEFFARKVVTWLDRSIGLLAYRLPNFLNGVTNLTSRPGHLLPYGAFLTLFSSLSLDDTVAQSPADTFLD